MKKTKIELDFDLKNASVNTLWSAVGTPLGMVGWFADEVKTAPDERLYTFCWEGGGEQKAKLIASRSGVYVRFRWEEDAGTEYFFELRISENELTGNVMLHITDFADTDSRADTILLWRNDIEEMMRKFGL